jgi:hypothetical protein
MEVKAQKDLETDEAGALLDTGGVFCAGATLGLPGMGGKAQESLIEDMFAHMEDCMHNSNDPTSSPAHPPLLLTRHQHPTMNSR